MQQTLEPSSSLSWAPAPSSSSFSLLTSESPSNKLVFDKGRLFRNNGGVLLEVADYSPALSWSKRERSAQKSTTKPSHMGHLAFLREDEKRNVFVSFDGLVAVSLSETPECVVTNQSFSSGVHVWEVLCPYDTLEMKLGVIANYKTNESFECAQTFKCTTARTITVELNLTDLRLSFWLNGSPQAEKTITLSPAEYTPFLLMTAKQTVFMLNPFCERPETQSTQTYGKNVGMGVLASQVITGHGLLVVKTPKMTPETFKENIDELTKKVPIDSSVEIEEPKAVLLRTNHPKDVQLLTKYSEELGLISTSGARLSLFLQAAIEQKPSPTDKNKDLLTQAAQALYRKQSKPEEGLKDLFGLWSSSREGLGSDFPKEEVIKQTGKFVDERTILLTQNEESRVLLASSSLSPGSGVDYAAQVLSFDHIEVSLNKKEWEKLLKCLDTQNLDHLLLKYPSLSLLIASVLCELSKNSWESGSRLKFNTNLHRFYSFIQILINSECISLEKHKKAMNEVEKIIIADKEAVKNQKRLIEKENLNEEDSTALLFNELPSLFDEEPNLPDSLVDCHQNPIKDLKKPPQELNEPVPVSIEASGSIDLEKTRSFRFSVAEHENVLRILLKIEEAIFSASISSTHSKDSWLNALTSYTSRLHTSFGRLLSFGSIQQSRYHPLELAEHGLFLRNGLTGDISHFQCPHWPVDISLSEDETNDQLAKIIRAQLPFIPEVFGHFSDRVESCIFSLSFRGAHVPEKSIVTLNQKERILCVLKLNGEVSLWGLSLVPAHLVSFSSRAETLQETILIPEAFKESLDFENENKISLLNEVIGCAYSKNFSSEVSAALQDLEEMGLPIEHALSVMEKAGLNSPNEILNNVANALHAAKKQESFENKGMSEHNSKPSSESRSSMLKAQWVCQTCSWINTTPPETAGTHGDEDSPISCEVCGTIISLSAFYTEEELQNDPVAAQAVEAHLTKLEAPLVDVEKELIASLTSSGVPIAAALGRLDPSSASKETLSRSNLDSLALSVIFRDPASLKSVLRVIRLCPSPDFVHRFLNFEDIRKTQRPRFASNSVFENSSSYLQHGIAPLLSELHQFFSLTGSLDVLVQSQELQNTKEIHFGRGVLAFLGQMETDSLLSTVPIRSVRESILSSDQKHTEIGMNEACFSRFGVAVASSFNENNFAFVSENGEVHCVSLNAPKTITKKQGGLASMNKPLKISMNQERLVVLGENGILEIRESKRNVEEVPSERNEKEASALKKEGESFGAESITPESVNRITESLHNKKAAALIVEKASGCRLLTGETRDARIELNSEANEGATLDLKFNAPLHILQIDLMLSWEKKPFDSLKKESLAELKPKAAGPDHMPTTEPLKGLELSVRKSSAVSQGGLHQTSNIMSLITSEIGEKDENEKTQGVASGSNTMVLPLSLVQAPSHPTHQFFMGNVLDASEDTLAACRYSNTDVVFHHLHGLPFVVNSVMVKSPTVIRDILINSKPLAAGLVFAAPHISHFSFINPDWAKITNKESVSAWFAKKEESGEPWLPWEPVGFFSLSENQTCVKFDIFNHSPVRYLLLRPTLLRKDCFPSQFGACLSFFGALGFPKQFSDMLGESLEHFSSKQSSSEESIIQGDRGIKVEVLPLEKKEREVIFESNEVPVEFGLLKRHSVQSSRLPKDLPFSGMTQLSISGKKIKETRIEKVSIQVSKPNEESDWVLKAVSVDILIEKGSSKTTALIQRLLDPAQYKLCLYHQIKKISDEKAEETERLTAIRLANELLTKAPGLLSCICSDIDLEGFIKANVTSIEACNINQVISFLDRVQRSRGADFTSQLLDASKNVLRGLFSLNRLSYSGLQLLWKLFKWAGSVCSWSKVEREHFLFERFREIAQLKMEIDPKYTALRNAFPEHPWLSFESHIFGPESLVGVSKLSEVLDGRNEELPMPIRGYHVPSELKFELVIDTGAISRLSRVQLFFMQLPLQSTFILKIWQFSCTSAASKSLLASRVIDPVELHQITQMAFSPSTGCEDQNSIVFCFPTNTLTRYLSIEIHSTVVPGLRVSNIGFPDKNLLLALPHVYGEKASTKSNGDSEVPLHTKMIEEELENPSHFSFTKVRYGRSQYFTLTTKQSGINIIKTEKENKSEPKYKTKRVDTDVSSVSGEEETKLQNEHCEELKYKKSLKEKQDSLEQILATASNEANLKKTEEICQEIQETQIQMLTTSNIRKAKCDYKQSLDVILTLSRLVIQELCKSKFETTEGHLEISKLLIKVFLINDSGTVKNDALALYSKLKPQDELAKFILFDLLANPKERFSLPRLISILSITQGSFSTLVSSLVESTKTASSLKTRKQRRELVNKISYNTLLADKLLETQKKLPSGESHILELSQTLNWVFKADFLTPVDRTALGYLMMDVLINVLKEMKTSELLSQSESIKLVIDLIDPVLSLNHERIWGMLTKVLISFLKIPQNAQESSASFEKYLSMVVFSSNISLEKYYQEGSARETEVLLGFLGSLLGQMSLESKGKLSLQILQPEVIRVGIEAICSGKFDSYPEVVARTFSLINTTASEIGCQTDLFNLLLSNLLTSSESLQLTMLDGIVSIMISVLKKEPGSAQKVLETIFKITQKNQRDASSLLIVHKFLNVLLFNKSNRVSNDMTQGFGIKPVLEVDSLFFLVSRFGQFLLDYLNLGGTEGACASDVHTVLMLEIGLDLMKLVQCSVTKEGSVQTLTKLFKTKGEQLIDGMLLLFEWYSINNSNSKTPKKSPAFETMAVLVSKTIEIFERAAVNQSMASLLLEKIQQKISVYEEQVDEIISQRVLSAGSGLLAFGKGVSQAFEEVAFKLLSNSTTINQFSRSPGIRMLFTRLEKCYSCYSNKEKDQIEQQKNEEALFSQLEMVNHIHQEKSLSQGSTGPFTSVDAASQPNDDECGNQLTSVPHPLNTTNITTPDWSAFKRGQKNRLAFWVLNDKHYDHVPLIASLAEPVDIRMLYVGFNNFWSDYADKILGTPGSVTVEAAEEDDGSLEGFSFLCTLERIDDEGYTNHSQVVMGKNFLRPSGNSFASSLISLRSRPIKFLLFKFSRPTVTLLEGISPLSTKSFSNLAIALSFVSVNGVKVIPNKVNVLRNVSFMRESSSMAILDRVFSSNQDEALTFLAGDSGFQNFLKESFSLFSQHLLIKYGQTVNMMLAALAKCDENLGTWVTEKLIENLDLNSLNPSFSAQSQLLLSVILESPHKFYLPRLTLLNEFMTTKMLQSISKINEEEVKLLQNFSQIVTVYDRCILRRVSAVFNSGELQLNLPSIVISLVKAMEIRLPKVNDSFVKAVKTLICIWLFSKNTFVFKDGSSLADAESLLLDYLLEKQKTAPVFLEILAMLVVGSASAAEKTVKSGLFEDLLAKIVGISSNDQPFLGFLDISSNSPVVSEYLRKVECAMTLYKKIRETHESYISPNENKSLLPLSQGDIEHAVSLITKLSIHNEKLSSEIAEELVTDVSKVGKSKCMSFVYDVIIKFLYSEPHIPVCIHLKDESAKRFVVDGMKLSTKDQAVKPLGSRIKSKMLTTQQTDKLYSELPKFLDEEMLSQFTESNWELAVSSSGTGEDITAALDANLCEKGPFMILISGLVEGVSQATVGIFCANPMPKLGVSGVSVEKNIGIKGSKGDFIFLYEGQNRFHFPMKPNSSSEFMSVQLQGSTNKGISIKDSSNEVIYLSLIHHMESYVDFYSLGPLPEEEDNFAGGDLQVSSTEFWVLSQPQAETYRSPMAAFSSIIQSKYHNSWNPFSTFRTFPVLSVPTSLTVSSLKHSINKNTKWRIKALNEKEYLKGPETVDSLLRSGESIVDLEVDAHSFTLASGTGENQAEEEPPRAPNLLLFRIFEKKKGIKCIIDACQESFSTWTNKEKVNRWKTWVDELNSFSQLPFFFSHVVRNNKLLELLFKIMTGAPDVNESSLRPEEKKLWRDEEHNAVRFTYSAIADVFRASNDPGLRETSMSTSFLTRFLKRLEIIIKEEPRRKLTPEEIAQKAEATKATLEEMPGKEESLSPQAQAPNPASGKKVPKKKGVGYGSDNTGDNAKWNVNEYLDSTKLRNSQTISLLQIIDSFFSPENYEPKEEMAGILIESALLPILESAFRSGSLLDIGKNIDLYDAYLKLTRTLANKKALLPCLLDLDSCYVPKQLESLYKLLGRLRDTASIFLRTVDPNKIESLENKDETKIQYKTAKRIIETFDVVQQAIESQKGETKGEEIDLEAVLRLPLPQKYTLLLKDLRFDYMDMKESPESQSYKHHYSKSITNPYTPPVPKMVRLAQEFADLSNALPIDHTNSIFVRVDKERVDVMKAMIMGAAGTPYAHGAFEFDIFFDDVYPNGPPKCNLETTGHGATRFNPNLYADGKVCLSLLGTWRGQASENWDPKISTILQVLVSIQAIIMSEDVYFNEPGYEGEAGSVEGEKKNEAYANIVRYSNIKFAMIEAIENPPKGFETVIRRHFFLKKDEILAEVREWLKPAENKLASYTGLVSDHNRQWCEKFKKSKNEYFEMLKSIIGDLEKSLAKLEAPSPSELLENKIKRKTARKPAQANAAKGKVEDLALVDVADDEEGNAAFKELDIEDEKVKDRWSRYIGAMGVEAVAKQAKARVFLSGLGAVGVEIAKNIVLAGVAQLSLHDSEEASLFDLSGQFFLSPGDLGRNRVVASLPRIQQLNYYVKCDGLFLNKPLPVKPEEYDSEDFSRLIGYDVMILVGKSRETALAASIFCEKNKKKLILVSVHGTTMRIFNDFGKEFTVLDVDGEEPQELLIKSITNAEEGLVTLVDGLRHNLQDGDEVAFTRVEGMVEMNKRIEKIKVVNAGSFKIGNTSGFSKYTLGGLMKKVKRPLSLQFKPYHEQIASESPAFDEQMISADLLKFSVTHGLHVAFEALDAFRTKRNQLPKVWSLSDSDELFSLAKNAFGKFEKQFSEVNLEILEKITRRLSFTARGTLPPLAAFTGGFVAQEAIKAITGKFTPVRQFFYLDCSEVIPELPKFEKPEEFDQFVLKAGLMPQGNRYDSFRVLLGGQVFETLSKCSLFMVGAGAIGCELLKNFAMLGVGTGGGSSLNSGRIELTDPDIIEVSNLNRQFLFREKHLRKPKSVTAAAAALQMNPDLKGHIFARLDKVHAGTANIYTDKYFESMSIVMNALDNIPARRYIDQRCVAARTPLIESGTLGPKGHVQVIVPGKTESYGSMKDPEEGGGEIPHCTLKMFPEETLHCIEWARDKFGKIFTEAPKTLNKVFTAKSVPSDPSEIQAIKVATKMMNKRPRTMEECVNLARTKFEKYYANDIKQLLYVYPLDAKTKEGQPFWALPKRPPNDIKFDPENKLHADFIAAYACLMAKIFGVAVPPNPRKQETKTSLARQAAKLHLPPFVPSDEKAKGISESVDKEKKAKEEQKLEEELEAPSKEGDLPLVYKEFTASCDPNEEKKPICFPEEFEKDNDANFHIDLIYAMANLRSENYKLEPMDWINVKLKAGRIVPALATTTACIAGLQTLELIKVLSKSKIEDIKSVFLNLAVPFLSLSEPGPAPSVILSKDLKVNLWDRWDVTLKENETLQKVLEHLEKTYGLIPRDVFLQSQPIYLDAVMSKNEKEKKQVLGAPIGELLGIDENERRVDLTVTFVHPEKPDVILKDTPPVRILLQKKN